MKKKYTAGTYQWIKRVGTLALILTFSLAGAVSGNAREESTAKELKVPNMMLVLWEQLDNSRRGVQPYVNAPETEEVIQPGAYPIMGRTNITVEQMAAYYQANDGAYPAESLAAGGAADILEFCRIYYEEAVAEGVKAEVAFTQTMKETGWLHYGGDSKIEQFNFAGLGTTGGGVQGNAFPDVRTGVRAQIQHLKAYATGEPLQQECVDGRYEYVSKGCAPYVEWLGQQENPAGKGWATGQRYGYDIVEMIQRLKDM